MNLTLKLPLAFFTVLLVLMGAAMHGLTALNHSLHVYDTQVRVGNENQLATAALVIAYKS